MSTRLFIVEPTGRCRLILRTYYSDGPQPTVPLCTARYGSDGGRRGYHNAEVCVDEDFPSGPVNEDGTQGYRTPPIPNDDPRFPTTCDCGYVFPAEAVHQVNDVDWYEGGGHRFAFGIGSWDGPPGAMMRTLWRDEDGRPPAYTIFLPNRRAWNTNDPSTVTDADGVKRTGPLWTVTGTAPNLTVSPSIDDQSPSRPWHGWIQNGEMTP